MSIITSILHCYGLLISEESVTLMQQYILPLWEKTKPELYEMFSTKSDNDEFFDYLLDHYAICYNALPIICVVGASVMEKKSNHKLMNIFILWIY